MNEPISQTRPSRFIRLLAVAGLAVLLVVSAAVPALAQSPAQAQYEGSAEGSGLRETIVGGLPFTGLDVIALFVVTLALFSIGFALRRRADFSPR